MGLTARQLLPQLHEETVLTIRQPLPQSHPEIWKKKKLSFWPWLLESLLLRIGGLAVTFFKCEGSEAYLIGA